MSCSAVLPYCKSSVLLLLLLQIHEEEWSYIPVGGPLPSGNQPWTAFGAAANLVHPATGFSVSRSLKQAPEMAEAAAAALAKGGDVQQVAAEVWDSLWSIERRQQVGLVPVLSASSQLLVDVAELWVDQL